MIPEFAIRERNETVPWTESEQVEQDLLICKALTEIYKDEYLNVLPMQEIPFSVSNKCYQGECNVLTYQLDELVGT